MSAEMDVEGLAQWLSDYNAFRGGLLAGPFDTFEPVGPLKLENRLRQAASLLRSQAEEIERLKRDVEKWLADCRVQNDHIVALHEERATLTRQLQEAVALLALARCPDEDCDGNGTKVGVVPVCCGAMDADGCCGRPLPEPQPEQCEWCHRRAALTERSKS